MNGLNTLAQPEEITHRQQGVRPEKVQERYHAAIAALLQATAQIGDNDDILFLLFGKLALHLKRTDALHLISEEIDTERTFGRKGKDIDDTAAHGILPRLVHIIHVLEAVAAQHFRHEVHIHLFARMEFQGFISQLLTGNDFFRQRIRAGNHAKPFLAFLQAAQHFRAENLVGGIFLSVLYGAAEGRGEEQHPFGSQNLCQVVIEIPGFFQIAENKDKRTFSPLYQHGRKQRSGRSAQAAAVEVTDGIVL